MIDLKRCNYITGQTNAVSFGVSKIIDFFENSGRTPIFLHKKDSTFKNLVHCSKIEFSNKNELDVILSNKSNFFRVDILVIDLWFLSNVSQVISYKKELDLINIDYVILSSKYHYIEGDPDVNIYKIEAEYSDEHSRRFDTKYLISDIVSNSKTTMDDLVLAFKRDKKLDDLFGGV